jgi:hypothetical protein
MRLGLPWRGLGWMGLRLPGRDWGWGCLRLSLGPGRRSVSKMFGGARGTGMLTAVRVQVTRAMLGL